MVRITRTDDQYFMQVDDNEPVALEVKQPNGWEPTIFLPENPTGRKLVNKKVADKRLEANPEGFELTDKPVRNSSGEHAPSVPNKRLVEYLKTLENGQELYDEYMAIIERAKAARDAAKKQPKSELEKAKEKLAKAMAKVKELEESMSEEE